ncbi:MAG: hypothetical protein ACTHWD_00175 [Lactobacillus delbrueckii]
MAESKSASVVFTNGSLLAKNAQAAAGGAKSAADNAYNLANSAQKTADGKNSVYRGTDPNTVPTGNLKAGDLYFTDNALYTWTGSTWEKTVSDTTGKEIHAKVEEAMAEKDKAIAELDANIKAKVAEIDKEIEDNKIQTGNALNFYKEQYYLSDSYTELTGGNWSDEVPTKTTGKYVWSRYVTANVGDPTNHQYSDPVCISGLDGKDGATGPQGPQGVAGPKGADGKTTYVHVAYANSADGKANFSVNYFADALYIGVLTDYTQADSTDYTQYTWSRLKGDAGDQGIPGPKGADGRTTYVHFAYANIVQLAQEWTSPKFTLSTQTVVRFGDEASERWLYKELPAGNYTANVGLFGTDPAWGIYKVVQAISNFSVTESSGRAYIGQYTDYTQADSTDPASYRWTRIKGETGPTGATGPQGPQGVAGPKGADGKTTYVHVAYANSADGKANFSVNYFADALYIGVLTDYTQADSTDYTQYTWSRLKGDAGDQGIPGPKGADGRTTYVHFAYANIVQLAQEWTSPKFTLSTQTVVRFGDEASERWLYKELPAGNYTANVGLFGTDPAWGIYKVVQAISNFSVTESSGRAYIGQYTDYTQADSTDPASYRWTRIKGETGPTGATGPKGEPGQTGFFIGTTPPPNPAKGTVWATNDSSGNMNSAKTWNGSSWVSTAFTQDLVAGNITATKIVGGELDVNKITVKNAQNIPITSTVSLGEKLSDISQDANSLKFTVENGAQNLILNSGNPSSTEHWWCNGDLRLQTHPFWKNGTENLFVLSNTSSTNEKVLGTDRFPIEPNKDYTLSYYAFNSWNIRDTDVWYLPRKTGSSNDWDTAIPLLSGVKYADDHAQYVTLTFNSGDYNEGYIRFDNNASTAEGSSAELWLTDIQLEKGKIATSWHQSPSDIAQLKITADSLNAYVKGSRGSKTLESILAMDPDHSSIAQVVNGQIAAAIGTYSDGSVRIDGKALYINADTKIENATIKSAMIDSIEADKIKSGTLDASQIRVINLDANSITTGSLSAVVNDLRKFETFVVSPSNTWNFDDTKSSYGNWFLIGETTADHVYNGPSYPNGQKLTPYMYVTSRGPQDCSRITVTVWKDNDPTQYQRVWDGNNWSAWVMLPNSQNLVSAINLSPDGVTISGKKIELDGNTTVTGNLNLLPKDQREVDQSVQGFHNAWHWRDSNVFAGSGGLQLQSTIISQQYSNDNTSIGGLRGGSSAAITTLAPTYLKFTAYPSWNDVKNNFSNQLARTYIDAGRIETNDVWVGNFRLKDSKMHGLNGSLYVTNSNGTNFDGHGDVGFQVWSGIGLGKNTIYVPGNDLYVQQGNCGPGLGARYSSSGKVDVHCNRVISQRANSVSSRLSVKTDITPVSYDRALAAVEGTEMYDYRYISDDTGQHYVSGIIDDVNPEDPHYHMDDMLINKERTARIDANLVGYHHVILQELLKKIDELEIKLKSLESKEK